MRVRYLTYKKFNFIPTTILAIVNGSMLSYYILAHGALGTNIPIFESIVSLTMIISLRFAKVFIGRYDVGNIVLFDLLVDMVMTIIMIVVMFIFDLITQGILLYLTLMIMVFIDPLIENIVREYEDGLVNGHKSVSRILTRVRLKRQELVTYGNLIGTGLGIIFITLLKVDIVSFSISMFNVWLMGLFIRGILIVKYLKGGKIL